MHHDLMTQAEVAKALRLSVRCLEEWRKKGIGLRWIQLEGTRYVRYRRSDVERILQEGVCDVAATDKQG